LRRCDPRTTGGAHFTLWSGGRWRLLAQGASDLGHAGVDTFELVLVTGQGGGQEFMICDWGHWPRLLRWQTQAGTHTWPLIARGVLRRLARRIGF
jgi:hypothetical protein